MLSILLSKARFRHRIAQRPAGVDAAVYEVYEGGPEILGNRPRTDSSLPDSRTKIVLHRNEKER